MRDSVRDRAERRESIANPDRDWYKSHASVWPEVVEMLEGTVWPELVVLNDIAWWKHQKAYHRVKIPTWQTMAKRWGWTQYAARQVMREAFGKGPRVRKGIRNGSEMDQEWIRDGSGSEQTKPNNGEKLYTDGSKMDQEGIQEPTTRARSVEKEKIRSDQKPDPPQPPPTSEPPQAPESGSAVELTLIPQQPDPAPKPADTTESRIDQVCAEWWRLWKIRAEKHPQGKPTKPHLPKSHRKAIRSVVAGKDPMITVDEAIWICRWMFYGTDYDAVHLRGENPKKEGATINQYLNPCSAYRVEKLGDKLHKSAVFRDNHETMKQLAVEQAKDPAPEAIPDYRREWEEALKSGKIQGRRSMKQ